MSEMSHVELYKTRNNKESKFNDVEKHFDLEFINAGLVNVSKNTDLIF